LGEQPATSWPTPRYPYSWRTDLTFFKGIIRDQAVVASPQANGLHTCEQRPWHSTPWAPFAPWDAASTTRPVRVAPRLRSLPVSAERAFPEALHEAVRQHLPTDINEISQTKGPVIGGRARSIGGKRAPQKKGPRSLVYVASRQRRCELGHITLGCLCCIYFYLF
jgi:hypothetical protein